MNKKKLNLIVIFALISVYFMIMVTYGICLSIVGVYQENPTLKYRHLTLILGACNIIPSILALLAIAKFSLNIKKSTNLLINLSKLLSFLEKTSYIQAAFTFVSVIFVAEIEDVGPPFVFYVTMFIVFISLTLALLFNTIRKIINND